MIKVMHVIHGLSTGGAETLVKDYSLKINKKIFDFVILCFDHYADSPYEKLLENYGINVIYACDKMKFYGRKGLLFKILSYFEKYFIVRKIIKTENPDIIHTHLPLNSYIKFARPKKNVKIFHTVHNELNVLWNLDIHSRRVDLKCAKWLVKKYNMRFIVLHDKMKAEVDNLFNVSNSIVLNNGIDFNRFIVRESKKEIRKKLNISSNLFVVGHVGRFNDQKNHSFLIDVFYEIYKKNNNSFLLLIGSGKEKEAIEKKIRELGIEKNSLILSNRIDIPSLLKSMDVFVFPSKYEGLGIALIEAQKMGLPCFISDRIPNEAIISNLVKRLSLELNPSDWSKCILEYEKPKEIVMDDDNWNMDSVVKRLEDIYFDKI